MSCDLDIEFGTREHIQRAHVPYTHSYFYVGAMHGSRNINCARRIMYLSLHDRIAVHARGHNWVNLAAAHRREEIVYALLKRLLRSVYVVGFSTSRFVTNQTLLGSRLVVFRFFLFWICFRTGFIPNPV